MALPSQWTWTWVDSGSWWWTGRPGVLQSMGSQRVGHDWVTELNWTEGLRRGECRRGCVALILSREGATSLTHSLVFVQHCRPPPILHQCPSLVEWGLPCLSAEGHQEREKSPLQVAKPGALGRKMAGERKVSGRVYSPRERLWRWKGTLDVGWACRKTQGTPVKQKCMHSFQNTSCIPAKYLSQFWVLGKQQWARHSQVPALTDLTRRCVRRVNLTASNHLKHDLKWW